MSDAALIVSIVALIVSAISLGWNVYSWKGAGPRVRLTGQKLGFPGDSPRGHVKIIAANTGRSPITVNEIGIGEQGKEGGILMYQISSFKFHPSSARLPAILDPGTEVSVYIDYESIGWNEESWRPYAGMAGGKMIFAKRVYGLERDIITHDERRRSRKSEL